MRNLVRFLTKNSFIFLFLFLEVVAFGLLVQNNKYQNSKFFNSSNFLVGNLYTTVNNIDDYFNLKDDNQILAQQNAKLQSTSLSSFIKVFGRLVQVNDTTYLQSYVYSSAKVINNSTNKRRNYIILDKGGVNGIKPEMGVISSKGVVGIVKNVSDHFSSVMSVLHEKNKLSAKIKKSGYFGSLVWGNNNYRIAELRDIPNHVNLEIGDTIVTSGFSSIFPENVMVGTVKEFDLPEGDNFYNIKVEFAEDYKNLSHVFVVRSLLKDEKEELENQNEEEL